MTLDERGDGSEVHLEPVFGHDGTERLLIGWAGVGGGEKGRDLGEVPLEPHGRDYLKRPSRRLARVPEGLRLAPWLEVQVAGSGDAYLAPDLTFEHVGVFVRTLEGVQRRGEDAGPDRVLDEREGSPALGTPYHETHA